MNKKKKTTYVDQIETITLQISFQQNDNLIVYTTRT